ncbi:tetratricopeptide repeat protein [Erwinia sp. Leaf53]|uniref:tetratricopeptide repeat protein n=1 Tax=Erwinia sp. Leaf53 TaxID=1736225 RepID=UPI0006F384B7|nr:SEL1-like repeat protein [Erwinia sp. Leaf53]KQN55679.1 hypothetical protein ASF13_09320 [Erwinia sp. Leaf53]
MKKIGWLLAACLGISACDSGSSQAEIEQKARAGDSSAQVELYRLYHSGQARGGSNHAEAMKWLNKAAQGNNAEAQYMLGVIYSSAESGEAKDNNAAAAWFEKSIENGGKPALLPAAVFFKNGWGVEKDEVRAFAYLLLAQQFDNKKAFSQDAIFRGALTQQQRDNSAALAQEIKQKYYPQP